MAHFLKEVERVVAAFDAPIATLRLDGGIRWAEALVEQLKEALRVPCAGLYSLVTTTEGVRPGSASFSRITSEAAHRHVRELLDTSALLFDPLLVDPFDRNQPRSLRELISAGKVPAGASAALAGLTRRRLGEAYGEQLRVLLAEGPTLLAWFGGVSDDPAAFGRRERAILNKLIPLMRRRFEVEMRLERAPLHSAALEVALDALVEPAFVVDVRGTPVLMNVGARQLWMSARLDTAQSLGEALRGDGSRFRLNPISANGLPRHWLLIRRAAGLEATARAAWAAKSWALTMREREVLEKVADGKTNATIGRELGCALRTVELHLTHVMTKARVSNRASLVARFWTGKTA